MTQRTNEQASRETPAPEIRRVFDGDNALFRIGLPGVTPELGYFITPWLIVEKRQDRVVVVDPGAVATIPYLVQALDSLGVKKVDFILLTHTHIDHMGGLRQLLERYPAAMVLCSANGHKHLMDPTKLMQASVQTLGDLGVAYGPIDPVPASSILPEGSGVAGFEMIETPGHSPHHVCFVYRFPGESVLFSGEAAGMCSRESADEWTGLDDGGDLYMRPATPPRLFYDVYAGSLEKIRRPDLSLICYGHEGFSREPRRLLDLHAHQIALWRDVIGRTLGEAGLSGAPATEESIEKAFRALLEEDRLLEPFHRFTGSMKEREESFIKNSIKGFTGYLLSLR